MSVWASLPAHILKHVSDLHLRQDDRAAAAGSCLAWRDAFSNVTLAPNNTDQNALTQQWDILIAKSIMGQILLTSQAHSQMNEPSSSSSPVKPCKTTWPPFFNPQPSCISLSISAFLSSSLHLYIPQLVQLKHLTIQWNMLMQASLPTPLSQPGVSVPA